MDIPTSEHTRSFLFGLTAGLRHVLYMHAEDSPEADLAVEILRRESPTELSETEARVRLKYVLVWDLGLWMIARLPDLPSRSERLRVMRYASEVAYLAGGPSRNRDILLEALRENLDLSEDDLDASNSEAQAASIRRRGSIRTALEFNSGEPGGGGGVDWEWAPMVMLWSCQRYLPVLDLFPPDSARWHYARERLAGSFLGIGRDVLFHLLSEAARTANEMDLQSSIDISDTTLEEKLSLVRIAAIVALPDSRLTRKTKKVLLAFAQELSVPERTVMQIIDEQIAWNSGETTET